jgi:hypothetical protein
MVSPPGTTGTGHRRAAESRWRKEIQMTHHVEELHTHEPMPEPVRDPEGSNGLVGYAAIKYAAIVIIVLAILAFLAWYVIPRIG